MDTPKKKSEKKEEPKSERTENLVAISVFILLIIIGIGIFTKGFGLFGKSTKDNVRVNVPLGNDPYTGNPNASVLIIAFSDYECPFCTKAEHTMQGILGNYKDKVVYVFKDFPLTGIHPHAYDAALAAECAKEQNKFWEYHEYIYAHNDKIEVHDLEEYAKILGLNEEQFNACLESQKYKTEVERDIQTGKLVGVSSTPTFFINGIKIVGAKPEETFTQVIDAELKSD